jgi:alpha-L-fucosidase
LQEIGQWTTRNGKAIYATRSTTNYNDDNVWFTQNRDGKQFYTMVCLPENQPLPAKVEWKENEPAKGSKTPLLHTGKSVTWKKEGDKILVNLPKGLPANLSALAFEY